MVQFRRAVFEICERAERQTNRQTDTLIAILHNPVGDEVNVQ